MDIKILLLLAAALCTAAANLFIRVALLNSCPASISPWRCGRLFREPLFVGGALVHVVAIILWLRLLSTTDVGSSYPSFVGLTFVFITLGAVKFCGERMTWLKALGLAIIILGIVLVTFLAAAAV
jgi:multidrug transporter EmrE-like cation transporter